MRREWMFCVFITYSFSCICITLHNPFKEAFENSFQLPYSNSFEKSGWMAPNIIREAIQVNKNFFFSADSFMLFTGLAPAYIGARMIDDDVQSCFYDAFSHKNCCQLPSWCSAASKYCIGIPIVALSALTIIGKTDEVRTTGRVFFIGMPFVIFGKAIIKKWDADLCLRPKNSNFCSHKKYYGGFPSGHMAEAIYAAVFAGMRFGAKAAIPLSIFSLFVGTSFVNCNRHYLSQIVAGAIFGAMYGLAANRVVENEMSQKYKISLDHDQKGDLALSIGWNY